LESFRNELSTRIIELSRRRKRPARNDLIAAETVDNTAQKIAMRSASTIRSQVIVLLMMNSPEEVTVCSGQSTRRGVIQRSISSGKPTK
jgi:hypothetical protein